MTKRLPILIILLVGFSIWSCERPKSPDFQIERSLETPLSLEEEYELLGTNEALIDTLSSNYVDRVDFDPFTDTLEANFSSLPDNQGDHIIDEANLIFQYSNEIPIDIDLSFLFLDKKRNIVFEKPINSEDRYIIEGNSDSETFKKGDINISFLDKQLSKLHKTRYIVLRFDLKLNEDVNLSDFSENRIRFKLNLNSEIISTVN